MAVNRDLVNKYKALLPTTKDAEGNSQETVLPVKPPPVISKYATSTGLQQVGASFAYGLKMGQFPLERAKLTKLYDQGKLTLDEWKTQLKTLERDYSPEVLGPNPFAGKFGFHTLVGKTAATLPYMGKAWMGGLIGGAVGAGAQFIKGGAAIPGPLDEIGMAKIGSMIGATGPTIDVEYNNLLADMVSRDIPLDVARTPAMIGGIVNGILENQEILWVFKGLKAAGFNGGAIVKHKLVQPLLKNFVKNYAKSFGSEVFLEEVPQGIMGNLSNLLADRLDGRVSKENMFKTLTKDIGQTVVEASQAMSLLPLGYAGLGAVGDYRTNAMRGQFEGRRNEVLAAGEGTPKGLIEAATGTMLNLADKAGKEHVFDQKQMGWINENTGTPVGIDQLNPEERLYSEYAKNIHKPEVLATMLGKDTLSGLPLKVIGEQVATDIYKKKISWVGNLLKTKESAKPYTSNQVLEVLQKQGFNNIIDKFDGREGKGSETIVPPIPNLPGMDTNQTRAFYRDKYKAILKEGLALPDGRKLYVGEEYTDVEGNKQLKQVTIPDVQEDTLFANMAAEYAEKGRISNETIIDSLLDTRDNVYVQAASTDAPLDTVSFYVEGNEHVGINKLKDKLAVLGKSPKDIQMMAYRFGGQAAISEKLWKALNSQMSTKPLVDDFEMILPDDLTPEERAQLEKEYADYQAGLQKGREGIEEAVGGQPQGESLAKLGPSQSQAIIDKWWKETGFENDQPDKAKRLWMYDGELLRNFAETLAEHEIKIKEGDDYNNVDIPPVGAVGAANHSALYKLLGKPDWSGYDNSVKFTVEDNGLRVFYRPDLAKIDFVGRKVLDEDKALDILWGGLEAIAKKLSLPSSMKIINDTSFSLPDVLGRLAEQGIEEAVGGAQPQGETIQIVPKNEGDVIGMRGPFGEHMNTVGMKPGKAGWLGNPVKWSGNGGKGTLQDAIDGFKKLFLEKVESDPVFRQAVLDLRGKKVGYYRPNDPNHLQVIQEWLANQPQGERKVETKAKITRADVKSNPDKVYLFGDNLIGKGMGGQAAEMRGEPNAIGIPTKKAPAMTEGSFFTDADFEVAKKAIDEAFASIPPGKTVVIPEAGLGTGRAQLQQRAPKIWAYLQQKLSNLSQPLANQPQNQPQRPQISTKQGQAKSRYPSRQSGLKEYNVVTLQENRDKCNKAGKMSELDAKVVEQGHYLFRSVEPSLHYFSGIPASRDQIWIFKNGMIRAWQEYFARKDVTNVAPNVTKLIKVLPTGMSWSQFWRFSIEHEKVHIATGLDGSFFDEVYCSILAFERLGMYNNAAVLLDQFFAQTTKGTRQRLSARGIPEGTRSESFQRYGKGASQQYNIKGVSDGPANVVAFVPRHADKKTRVKEPMVSAFQSVNLNRDPGGTDWNRVVGVRDLVLQFFKTELGKDYSAASYNDLITFVSRLSKDQSEKLQEVMRGRSKNDAWTLQPKTEADKIDVFESQGVEIISPDEANAAFVEINAGDPILDFNLENLNRLEVVKSQTIELVDQMNDELNSLKQKIEAYHSDFETTKQSLDKDLKKFQVGSLQDFIDNPAAVTQAIDTSPRTGGRIRDYIYQKISRYELLAKSFDKNLALWNEEYKSLKDSWEQKKKDFTANKTDLLELWGSREQFWDNFNTGGINFDVNEGRFIDAVDFLGGTDVPLEELDNYPALLKWSIRLGERFGVSPSQAIKHLTQLFGKGRMETWALPRESRIYKSGLKQLLVKTMMEFKNTQKLNAQLGYAIQHEIREKIWVYTDKIMPDVSRTSEKKLRLYDLLSEWLSLASEEFILEPDKGLAYRSSGIGSAQNIYNKEAGKAYADDRLRLFNTLALEYGIGQAVDANIPQGKALYDSWTKRRESYAFFGSLPAELKMLALETKRDYYNSLLDYGIRSGAFASSNVWKTYNDGYMFRYGRLKRSQQEANIRQGVSNKAMASEKMAKRGAYESYSHFKATEELSGMEVVTDFAEATGVYLAETLDHIDRHISVIEVFKRLPGPIAGWKMVMYEHDIDKHDTVRANAILERADYMRIPEASGLAQWFQGTFARPYVHKNVSDLIRSFESNPYKKSWFDPINKINYIAKRTIMANPMMWLGQFLLPIAVYKGPLAAAKAIVEFAYLPKGVWDYSASVLQRRVDPFAHLRGKGYEAEKFYALMSSGLVTINANSAFATLYDFAHDPKHPNNAPLWDNVSGLLASKGGLDVVAVNQWMSKWTYELAGHFYDKFRSKGWDSQTAATRAAKFVGDITGLLNGNIWGEEKRFLQAVLFARDFTWAYFRSLTGATYPLWKSKHTYRPGAITNALFHGESTQADMSALAPIYLAHLAKMAFWKILFINLVQAGIMMGWGDDEEKKRKWAFQNGNVPINPYQLMIRLPSKWFKNWKHKWMYVDPLIDQREVNQGLSYVLDPLGQIAGKVNFVSGSAVRVLFGMDMLGKQFTKSPSDIGWARWAEAQTSKALENILPAGVRPETSFMPYPDWWVRAADILGAPIKASGSREPGPGMPAWEAGLLIDEDQRMQNEQIKRLDEYSRIGNEDVLRNTLIKDVASGRISPETAKNALMKMKYPLSTQRKNRLKALYKFRQLQERGVFE